MKLVNKKGFTLAEVLITVGIIGVVAAITMPSLMSGWQNKAYSTMAHRFYSLYNQAIETMIKDDMAINITESRTARIAVNSQDGFWPKYFHLITATPESLRLITAVAIMPRWLSLPSSTNRLKN